MKRASRFEAILLAVLLAILACSLPANPDRIQRYLSGTQTAEAGLQIPTSETAAEPIDNLPEYPPDSSRCGLFTGLELPVYLLDAYSNSPSLVIYVEFPGGVIGLDDDTDDGFPWEYSASLGDIESLWCAVFEEAEHAGRLYCMLPLPKEYQNTAQPLSVQVNYCDIPIISIPKQSVMVEDPPVAGSSGGSPGGSGSEGGSEGIEGILGIFTTVCGSAPAAHTYEDNGYQEWCECMGGIYSWEASYNMAGIEDGIMQTCTLH